VLAAAFTAAYMLRMSGVVFFGELNPRWRGLHDLQKTEVVAGALLIAAILWMGVFPKPFTDRIRDGVEDLPGVQSAVNAGTVPGEHRRVVWQGPGDAPAALVIGAGRTP
jgi:NADH:ubiquinone oxidoreductase subunit 4 (subunit M)